MDAVIITYISCCSGGTICQWRNLPKRFFNNTAEY